ncbi:hypothetical protein B8W69_06625 [Mycobacterium vulneris]|uniref:HNH nuclease domain-containing protein n=1 Tax=Mycolicibacterium vulneris TaxID=547163 RepID=A0A1X2L9U8_9MYCO|nr:HNH endonuclease [Mycolicibacterium vulneris]OSC30705.1 hypothetical protein B8W69_06625 [Mycolicibacterium vulneris]
MRAQQKGAKPQILVKNELEWTNNYVKAQGTPDEKKHEKWRHPSIKAQLNEDSAGKCVYCESTMGHICYPHVDHIKPKSAFPQLAHIWANLAWACQMCNIQKLDYNVPQAAILDPYTDNIAEHLRHRGEFISPHPASARGAATVEELKLNRRTSSSKNRTLERDLFDG